MSKGQRVGIVIMGGHFCHMERGGQNISTLFIGAYKQALFFVRGGGISEGTQRHTAYNILLVTQ